MRDLNRFGLAVGFAAALAFVGTARAQAPGEPGSQEMRPSDQPAAGTQGERPAQQPQIKEKLVQHLEKLHAANQAEVHMGEMGEQNAASPEVKEYARKLANDHKQLDEKLTAQASTLGVTLEGKEYRKASRDAEKDMKKLEGKSGADFDKEFMSMAVKDHKQDRKDVQKAAKEARNENQQELVQLLDNADAGMAGHLDEAERIKEQVDRTAAQRQGRRGTREATQPSDTGATPN
jgi:putative membrane protein